MLIRLLTGCNKICLSACSICLPVPVSVPVPVLAVQGGQALLLSHVMSGCAVIVWPEYLPRATSCGDSSSIVVCNPYLVHCHSSYISWPRTAQERVSVVDITLLQLFLGFSIIFEKACPSWDCKSLPLYIVFPQSWFLCTQLVPPCLGALVPWAVCLPTHTHTHTCTMLPVSCLVHVMWCKTGCVLCCVCIWMLSTWSNFLQSCITVECQWLVIFSSFNLGVHLCQCCYCLWGLPLPCAQVYVPYQKYPHSDCTLQKTHGSVLSLW